MEMIFGKGMAGNFAHTSALILEAASPMISRQRVNAITSVVFVERSVRSCPTAISNAVAAASRMWRNRTVSGLGIQNQRVPNDLLAEIAAEIHGCA